MPNKKPENMKDDELMQRWTKAAAELEDAKEAVRALSTEYHTRERRRVLDRQLANLTDEDRAFLTQTVIPEGIESQEGNLSD